MHDLIFLEPGHFHAALLLAAENPSCRREVEIFAPEGPELAQFLTMVERLNGALVRPWQLRVIRGDFGLETICRDRQNAIVVLAGRNGPRLSMMQSLHDAGHAILADKPWITDSKNLPYLHAVTAGPPIVDDIMTSRVDTGARLRKRIVADTELFGGFDTGATLPALELSSLHHLCKMAAGKPLKRPAWYYDVEVQGDGIVDLHSHMTDQAFWLIADDRPVDLAGDIELVAARRWPTEVPLPLFRQSTDCGSFPENLRPVIRGDVLDLACNGEIEYRLHGISVRQRAEWGLQEPPDGGDSHYFTARGRHATLTLRHDADSSYRSELTLSPTGAAPLDGPLADRLEHWQTDFPGLSAARIADGWRLHIPADIQIAHEAQFPLVLDAFLSRLTGNNGWSAVRAGNLHARYAFLAQARNRALGE